MVVGRLRERTLRVEGLGAAQNEALTIGVVAAKVRVRSAMTPAGKSPISKLINVERQGVSKALYEYSSPNIKKSKDAAEWIFVGVT